MKHLLAVAIVALGPLLASSALADDDHGLGLEWLWINADVGYSYANLSSFNAKNFALQNTESSGLVAGGAVGVRLLFLTLGVRARDLPMSNFNLVELDGEAGFHSRMGNGDLYFGARGGYAFSGSLSTGTLGSAVSAGGTPPDVNVHGGNVGLMLGFDYYFNHFISIGIDANPETLFLQRPAATPPSVPQAPAGACPPPVPDPNLQQACNNYMTALAAYNSVINSPIYKESGSSIGFAFLGTAHLGIHF